MLRRMESSAVFINSRRKLRAGWRILLYIALNVVFGLAVTSLYSAAVAHVPSGAAARMSGDPVPEYVLLAGTALFTAFLILRFVDRCPFRALGFALHGRVWVEIGQGVFLGFVMVSVVFFVEWGAGWTTVSWSVSSGFETLRLLTYYIVLFALAGAFEELATRGYAFQALIQGTGKTMAVCITSIVFGLGHTGNPHAGILGVINTMLAGVWLSLAYLKTRSLWLPTGLHTSWNLSLGFVYGFPVSGMPYTQSMVRLDDHGPVLLTGGAYGPEAGAVMTLVVVLGTLFLWFSGNFRPSERAIALWHTPAPAQIEKA